MSNVRRVLSTFFAVLLVLVFFVGTGEFWKKALSITAFFGGAIILLWLGWRKPP